MSDSEHLHSAALEEPEIKHKHDKEPMEYRQHEKSHPHTQHGGNPEGHKHPHQTHEERHEHNEHGHHKVKKHDHKEHTREHHKTGQ